MKVEKLVQESVSIARLSGRFDAYEAPIVHDWIKGLLEEKVSNIVVNLHEVNFIDSTGLATLVQGMKQARDHGGDLKLSNLPQSIRIIFELTRLDKAFDIFSAEDQAIGSFGK